MHGAAVMVQWCGSGETQRECVKHKEKESDRVLDILRRRERVVLRWCDGGDGDREEGGREFSASIKKNLILF